jgi:hypothetical protein
MRMIKNSQIPDPDLPYPRLTPADHRTLSDDYVRFATCIDDLPPYLLPDSAALSAGDVDSTHHKFAAQIVDLQITYHSLKMHLTRNLEEMGYFSWVGGYKEMLVLRKTEIARDMVRFLQAVPFWTLQINGEPCVRERLTLELV